MQELKRKDKIKLKKTNLRGGKMKTQKNIKMVYMKKEIN